MEKYKGYYAVTILTIVCINYATAGIESRARSPSNYFSSCPDLSTKLKEKGNRLKITPNDIERSVAYAIDIVEKMRRFEDRLEMAEINVKRDTVSFTQLMFGKAELLGSEQAKQALIASKATQYLMNAFCFQESLSTLPCAKHITDYDFYKTDLKKACAKFQRLCSPNEIKSKYRSIEGTCNNAFLATQGQSFTAYRRLLFADYLDGVHAPRRSVNPKFTLPSPRLISNTLVKHGDVEDPDFTLALMQWGQFIAHDLAHTSVMKMVHSNERIECCAQNGQRLLPRYMHPFCLPIDVPTNDAFYSKEFMVCIPYVRSVPAMRNNCVCGPIEQLNEATHYIDGSQIYGSDEKKIRSLRSFAQGQLAHSRGYLMPSKVPEEILFNGVKSGDSRANFQPQLTAMHVLWHREHNRIAKKLANLNHNWDDDKLFEESRRIVIAEMQHITYVEWLPNIISIRHMAKIYNFGYNAKIDASVGNSFATGAFRFLKSMLSGEINLLREDRTVNTTLYLRNVFNNPKIVQEPGYLDALIRGLATQHSRKLDLSYSEDVYNFMFGNGKIGFDIFSLDIQRGRDHGLPSYTSYRKVCGLSSVQSFDGFLDVMDKDTIKKIQTIYKEAADVDLLVGGLAEMPLAGSLLGPTFSCIITDQFLRTRTGDRYFYTNTGEPFSFKEQQLKEIRKTTLARIFCDNANEIEKMQPNVFLPIKDENLLVDCRGQKITRVDLEAWKEK